MKRILTSLLLLLMLTFSVHPILSLHFCEDELMSLNIGVKSNGNMCCSSAEAGDNENAKFPILILTESESSCCTITDIEVLTDNFVSNSSQSIQTPTESTFIPGWFALDSLINLTAPEATIKSFFNFPSSGFYIKTLDFLSLISVYRL